MVVLEVEERDSPAGGAEPGPRLPLRQVTLPSPCECTGGQPPNQRLPTSQIWYSSFITLLDGASRAPRAGAKENADDLADGDDGRLRYGGSSLQ